MTHDLSSDLQQLLQREAPVLRAFPEVKTVRRPRGESSWSPKEELGHLIDSAANNHVRFVRALLEPEFHGASYAQNEWVSVHRYQEMPWVTIVEFWWQYNNFISAMLTLVPENKLQTLCFVGSDRGVTLQFLVADYVLHMRHHLDHLLGREQVTVYPAATPDH